MPAAAAKRHKPAGGTPEGRTMVDVITNLARRGLTLPPPPPPGGAYVPVRVLGGVAYVAAQFPIRADGVPVRGRLGRELTTEDGYRAAELCALNVLAQIHQAVGVGSVLG